MDGMQTEKASKIERDSRAQKEGKRPEKLKWSKGMWKAEHEWHKEKKVKAKPRSVFVQRRRMYTRRWAVLTESGCALAPFEYAAAELVRWSPEGSTIHPGAPNFNTLHPCIFISSSNASVFLGPLLRP
jgi:hypothetical protein